MKVAAVLLLLPLASLVAPVAHAEDGWVLLSPPVRQDADSDGKLTGRYFVAAALPKNMWKVIQSTDTVEACEKLRDGFQSREPGVGKHLTAVGQYKPVLATYTYPTVLDAGAASYSDIVCLPASVWAALK